MTSGKRIEVRSADGHLLCTLHLFDEGSGRARSQANSASEHGSNGVKESAPMTSAQRRYLGRILAVRGVDEEATEGNSRNSLAWKISPW
jgi:hypothetical protein